ncbi:hypothetical protein K491DRAFT_699023 [Lophiostoma macrostomum CBS 122681]|uniref:Uncharacterized protein n=1 Tax=Lophiostoma macrostomum CBS 122681 TaxID=1314788 RepID=A0A6A6SLG5_9PLEO|nr:hypothetical protein K491DRAFT_699023 [Lophiostoma macrostomum CBS 122681]
MSERQSSGVRNLRAMFEKPGAASPEPRGRSPGGRFDADDNRPPSKVRASFVSVDAPVPRDLGAIKGTVDGINSPQAHRRESFSVSEDASGDAVAELKRVVSEEKEARKNSQVIAEAVPEQAVETRESSRAPPAIREAQDEMPNLGSIMKGADFPEPQAVENKKPEETPEPAEPVQAAAEQPQEADTIEEKMAALSVAETPADNPDKVSGVQEEASLKPADPKDEATISGGGALPPPTEVLPSANAATKAPETPKAPAATPSKAKANGTADKSTTNGTPTGKRPAAISTAKASSSQAASAKSPMPRSPGVARLTKPPTTPKTPTAASSTKASAAAKEAAKPPAPKETAKAPAPKTSRASLRPSTSSTTAHVVAKAKAPVAEAKKPASKPATAGPAAKDGTTTSPSGFKKPRPKSPTRPVRLPSHLTAPTASSSAKHEEDGSQKLARKSSTVSRPAAPKAAPAARKQTSRASLAPSTTSSAAPKRPTSRASTRGGADEGFLARMMRPTASSASKTHDKPASPPRRAPSTRASTKPKEGILAKGKQKAGEIASKAKEAVSNGHSEDHHDQEPEASASNGAVNETFGTSAPAAESEREATPAEQVESSTVELQTPQFNEQLIR